MKNQTIYIITLIILSFCFQSSKKIDFENKEIPILVANSPNGNLCAISKNRGTIDIVDINKDSLVSSTKIRKGVGAQTIIFLNDYTLLIGLSKGNIYIWNFNSENGELQEIEEKHKMGNITGNFSKISFEKKIGSKELSEHKTVDNAIISSCDVIIPASKGLYKLNVKDTTWQEKKIDNILIRKTAFFSQLSIIKESVEKLGQIKTFLDGTMYFFDGEYFKCKNLNKYSEKELFFLSQIKCFDVSDDQKYSVIYNNRGLYLINNKSDETEGTKQLFQLVNKNKEVVDIAFANNIHVFIATSMGDIELWNVKSMKLIAIFNNEHFVSDIQFNQKNNLLIAREGKSKPNINIHPYLLLLDNLKVKKITTPNSQKNKRIEYTIHTSSQEDMTFDKEDFGIIDYSVISSTTTDKLSKSPVKSYGNKTYHYDFELQDFSDVNADLRFAFGLNKLRKYKEDLELVTINYDYFISKPIKFYFLTNHYSAAITYYLPIAPVVSNLNTHNDAKIISSLFDSQNGVPVIRGNETYAKNVKCLSSELIGNTLTEIQIKKVIKEKLSKVKAKDQFILYFSSHGIKTDRKDLKFSVDTMGNYILYSELLTTIYDNTKCHNYIIIIDACFSGEIISATQDWLNGFKKVPDNLSLKVIMSSSANETSKEFNKVGIMTKAIESVVNDYKKTTNLKSNILTVEELYNKAKEYINDLYETEPTLKTSNRQELQFYSYPVTVTSVELFHFYNTP